AGAMFVKICGITRLEDAEAAVAAGASAIGFILWPGSPRVVDVDTARAIAQAVPASVMKVGVVVNQPADEINSAADRIGLTHVQLHGDESAQVAAAIERPIIKATTASVPLAFDEWAPDTIWLVDAYDPIRRGGTGRTVDWLHAAAIARDRRVLLAGG